MARQKPELHRFSLFKDDRYLFVTSRKKNQVISFFSMKFRENFLTCPDKNIRTILEGRGCPVKNFLHLQVQWHHQIIKGANQCNRVLNINNSVSCLLFKHCKYVSQGDHGQLWYELIKLRPIAMQCLNRIYTSVVAYKIYEVGVFFTRSIPVLYTCTCSLSYSLSISRPDTVQIII
jgi:hypothetical protein